MTYVLYATYVLGGVAEILMMRWLWRLEMPSYRVSVPRLAGGKITLDSDTAGLV